MQNSNRCVRILAIISWGLWLSACDHRIPPWNAGNLVVIVPESLQGAQAEFERELAKLFADQLHDSLDVVTVSEENIRSALNGHKAHLSVASSHTGIAMPEQKFGPDYQTVREWVVCNRDRYYPRKLSDLSLNKLGVVSGSPHEIALLEALQKTTNSDWKTYYDLTAPYLLAKVSEGTLGCTIANELQLADALNYYANLVAAFDIGSPFQLAWEFPDDADPDLLNQVQIFFERIRLDGTLRRLEERYYGHNQLATMDAAAFVASIRTVLPRYRHLFEEAAGITGIDWRLLAALAYQESQWDPLATSYTNVRGMMMLTEDTADQMKVENRLDVRESVLAGARYLALLKEHMPTRVPEPDRTWFALAAYNQGSSHLEDARVLTEHAKLNPDSWADVKKQMPYLNRPEYYKWLKHGYARGGEAVALVENIRSYYDMLKRLKPDHAYPDMDTISYRLIEPLKRLLR